MFIVLLKLKIYYNISYNPDLSGLLSVRLYSKSIGKKGGTGSRFNRAACIAIQNIIYIVLLKLRINYNISHNPGLPSLLRGPFVFQINRKISLNRFAFQSR